MSLNLNAQAWALADELERSAATFRVSVTHMAEGGRLIDAGVSAPGGLAAGLHLARICLAGAGEVSLIPARPGLSSGWDVCVRTDHPVQACLAAQYAGWQIQVGKFFAMGSGPMRAVASREALITDLKQRDLLKETLIVWAGEFGRTPMSQGGSGRDHHNKGYTIWMAGGGVRGGQVYGATHELGYAAVENPVEVFDLHATMLHLLGVDHKKLTYKFQGRDFRLTDVHGNVVNQILA